MWLETKIKQKKKTKQIQQKLPIYDFPSELLRNRSKICMNCQFWSGQTGLDGKFWQSTSHIPAAEAPQFTKRNPFVDKLSIYSRTKTILYTHLWEARVVKIKSGVERDELIGSKLQKRQRLKQLEWMRLLWTTKWSDKEGWGSMVTHFSINHTAWSGCSHVTIFFWPLSCFLSIWTR